MVIIKQIASCGHHERYSDTVVIMIQNQRNGHNETILSVIGYPCHSLTDWLPNSLLFSWLDWCAPGMWRCQLKTCWGCYCCWCLVQIWKLKFGHKVKFLFRLRAQGLVKIFKLKLRQYLKLEFGQFFLLMFCRGYEVESWSRFWS